MTLSKEMRRLLLLAAAISVCGSGPLAAAPFAVAMRSSGGLGQRVLAPQPRQSAGGVRVRSPAGRHGGRLGAGIGVAVLPFAAFAAPNVADAAPEYGDVVGRPTARWVRDEVPSEASCFRPLIINLRASPRNLDPGPRVIYGTAPRVCPED